MTKQELLDYIERYVKNSAVESFTNLRLQNILTELANDSNASLITDAANTTALQALSGASYTYVIVTGSGIYEWAASGTPNGSTIFAASGGGVWNQIFSGGGGGGTWGSITGTLSSQTDLQSALDSKASSLNELSDVVITTPANGDILEYSGSNFINTNKSYTELTGTNWDGSNKYKTSLSADFGVNLNSTKIAGLLVIEDNNSHLLSINGNNIPINATTPTVIGFTKANGVYYIIDKDGLTIQISSPDVTAPTVSSAEAIDANTIRIVFNESMGSVTTAGWSFKQNGSTITPDSVTGSTTTWDFVVSETMLNTDTILRNYNSGTGATTDLVGNELVSFTDQSVTNNIITPVNLTFTVNQDNLTNTSQVFTATTPDTNFDNGGANSTKLASGVSGRIWFKYTSPTGSVADNSILAFMTTQVRPVGFYGYENIYAGVFVVGGGSPSLGKITNGTVTTGLSSVSYNEYYGLYRNGSTGVIKVQKSTDEVTWTDVNTLSINSTADLWPACAVYGTDCKLSYPKAINLS